MATHQLRLRLEIQDSDQGPAVIIGLGRRAVPDDRPVRSRERGPTLHHLDAEPPVDRPVVGPTEQYEVVEGRLSPVGPVTDVMSVAPSRRPPAAGEPTPAVSDGDRPSESGRNDLGAPAELKWFGGSSSDHACHVRVAREATCGLRRDRASVLELGESSRATRTLDEALEVDRDHHVRALAADRRTIARSEPLS